MKVLMRGHMNLLYRKRGGGRGSNDTVDCMLALCKFGKAQIALADCEDAILDNNNDIAKLHLSLTFILATKHTQMQPLLLRRPHL